jgi:hypothetical protein
MYICIGRPQYSYLVHYPKVLHLPLLRSPIPEVPRCFPQPFLAGVNNRGPAPASSFPRDSRASPLPFSQCGGSPIHPVWDTWNSCVPMATNLTGNSPGTHLHFHWTDFPFPVSIWDPTAPPPTSQGSEITSMFLERGPFISLNRGFSDLSCVRMSWRAY